MKQRESVKEVRINQNSIKIFILLITLSTECREYAQKTIHTILIAPTLIGGKPHEIKVDKCKHKPVALIVGKQRFFKNKFVILSI